MAAQIPGVPPNIALINGPMLLGNLFGYGLYGVLVVQVFLYHSSFKRDPLWMRCLVYGVFFVDTIVTALGTVTAWDEMAGGWGDLNTLIWLDWPFNALPCLSGLVSSSVHFFFCWRIWKLTGSILLPIPIACISLVQWAMASYCGITSVKIGVPRITELEPFVITWLGGSALVDIIITVAMVTILFRAGSKSAFSQTNSVMAKLIKLTVETGMATTIGAVTELIFFLVFRTNNMHFIPFLMLAKLYSNTLLATLNSRAVFGANKARQPAALWDDDVSSGSRSTNSGHNINKFSAAPGVVSITTTTERRNDLEMNDFSDPSLKGSWRTKPSYVDFDAPPPPPRKL